MPEASISYLFGIGSSQSQKHSYSSEDARILFRCSATASSAVLLSLTTSCATTCQTQPASSEGRLALLEREGHGLPVKVEYVGTAGQQPFILRYGWRPGSAREKGRVGLGWFFLVQVAQTKASYCTYDESNGNAVAVRQGWASPQRTVGSGEATSPCPVTNSDAEPVLRCGINQTSFYHVAASRRFAFTSWLSVFTAGTKRSNRSEGVFVLF